QERNDQMVRLIGRYGFEFVPPATTVTMAEHARRLGENIFISLIVLARNQAALRRDTLRRGRTRVFMSRKVLEQRYGRGEPDLPILTDEAPLLDGALSERRAANFINLVEKETHRSRAFAHVAGEFPENLVLGATRERPYAFPRRSSVRRRFLRERSGD